MEITTILRDDKDAQVQVEEIRRLDPGEPEESVTHASALADEVLGLLDPLGEADTVSGVR